MLKLGFVSPLYLNRTDIIEKDYETIGINGLVTIECGCCFNTSYLNEDA